MYVKSNYHNPQGFLVLIFRITKSLDFLKIFREHIKNLLSRFEIQTFHLAVEKIQIFFIKKC